MKKPKFRRCPYPKYPYRHSFKKTLGIILAVAGLIVIIQVVPINLWKFMFGILLICLGWLLFKTV